MDRWKSRRRAGILIAVVFTVLTAVTVVDPFLIIERLTGRGTEAGTDSGQPSGEVDAGSGPSPVTSNLQLNIPWAIGGERFEADGTLVDFPGEWPSLPVQGIRLWDTRTAWLNIEPARGQWDFSRLDEYISTAERRGVTEIVMVLGGTPLWAASQLSSTEAPWLGPGSASPPRSIADWETFVRTVATRYAGRIAAYEIWNEPSGTTFWSGTAEQWAELVASASPIIRRIDPAAAVIASGFVLTGMSDLDRLDPWVAALQSVDPDLSAISVHWYPKAGTDVSRLRAVTRGFRERLRRTDLPTQLWITEVNVIGGSGLTADGQRRAMRGLHRQADRLGISHLYWYAWSDLISPELIPIHEETPGAMELTSLYLRPDSS